MNYFLSNKNYRLIISVVLIIFLLSMFNVPQIILAEDSPSISGESEISLSDQSNNDTTIENETGDNTEVVGGISSELLADTEENVDDFANDDAGATEGGGESIGTTTIITGEAIADSLVVNQENVNFASSVCDICLDDVATSSTDVDNTNIASTTNEIMMDGNTGDNEITTTTNAVIQTGDISLINYILNFINMNFSGDGRNYLINIFNELIENIDLSGYGDLSMGDSSCQVENCMVAINSASTSTLSNDLKIDANTGDNSVVLAQENAIIQTGDINIVNDVFNIANLNVAGDNWFFAVVNIFGELQGDIVLPGWNGEPVASQATSTAVATSSVQEILVTNTNTLSMLNDVIVDADSGNNFASSSNSSLINTGEVNAKTAIFNLLNYNVFGKKWTLAKVNIFGDWQGVIQNLPPGYDYFTDNNGVTIFNNFKNDNDLSEMYAKLALTNFNYSETLNKIEINADTGNNSILHSQNAGIDTGSINIQNALLNFINANFIGDSWEFSMINVFGKWVGNLAFGQPDLWINESTQTGIARHGDYVTFSYIFGNNGDGSATGVKIVDDYDEDFLNLGSSEILSDGSKAILNVGDLPPNSQGSISYSIRVNDNLPYGNNEVKNTAAIVANEGDRNAENNLTSGMIIVDGGNRGRVDFNVASNNNGGGSGGSLGSGFSIIKTNNATDVVRSGDKVDFQIIVKNIGSQSATKVFLSDTMKNREDGTEINYDLWDLQEVKVGEEIVVSYTVEIKDNIKSGEYINEATVEGFDEARNAYISAIASSKIKVENENARVLSAEASPQLSIGKISRKNRISPGDSATNEIVIANNGNLVAEGVKIIESLSRGLVFSDDGSGVKEWELGMISPGEIKKIAYSYTVNRGVVGGIYTFATLLRADNHETVAQNFYVEVTDGVIKDQFYADLNGSKDSYGYSHNSNNSSANQQQDLDSGLKEVIKDAILDSPITKSVQAASENNKPVDKFISHLDYDLLLLLSVLLLAIILYFILRKKVEKNDIKNSK